MTSYDSRVMSTMQVVKVFCEDLGLECPDNGMCGKDGTRVADLQSELDGGQTGWEVGHQRWADHHWNNTCEGVQHEDHVKSM